MKQVIPAAAIALMASTRPLLLSGHLTMRRTNRSWTCEEEDRLRELCSRNASAYRTAIALKRSTAAVQTKARELGLPSLRVRKAPSSLE